MRVLITGGAGFIGSNLTRYYLAKGNKVHVVDNLSTGSEGNIEPFKNDPNFFFDNNDILTWKELDKAVSGADIIYHLAAVVGVFKVLEEPIQVLATNIAGCERLLRAAVRNHWNPHVIIASSSEVYGNRLCPNESEPLHEDMELLVSPGHNTRWNYSISKMADEAFGHSYVRKFGLNVTVVRFFNVVGPNQMGRYGMVLPRFVKQAVSGEDITVYGSGKQTRSFIDVRDAVRALDLLTKTDKSHGKTVNVGSDHEITIGELAEIVRKLAQSKSSIVNLPYDEVYGKDFEEINFRRPNLKKLHSLIDFEAEWDLEKTILNLIDIKREALKTG